MDWSVRWGWWAAGKVGCAGEPHLWEEEGPDAQLAVFGVRK